MRWAITLLCLLLLGAKHPSTCRISVPLGGGVSNGGTAAKFMEDQHYDYAITAAHVVTERGQLYPNVHLSYGSGTVAGRVVGHDRRADVAIVRTKRTGIAYQPLTALTGKGRYWSEGMVSGVKELRYRTSKWRNEDVQYSAFTNVPQQGDSGAPVRDESGRIVAVLWGGSGEVGTMTTSAQVIYRRVPTPLRNIVRLATFHRPVNIYRPTAVSGVAPGSAVFAPSQIRCAPGTVCAPNYLAYSGRGVRPVIEEPRPEPPPYVEPEPPAAQPEPQVGPRGPAGPQGPQGPPGEPGEVDYERIIEGVVRQLPQPDIDKIAEAVIAKLPPIEVQTQNTKGEIIAENSYPYPGPIKIQYYQLDPVEFARRVRAELDK